MITAKTETSRPLVSVGCAVYNGAETLRRALDGLVRQDYPCVEIIICDDGSTDNSRAICREYSMRNTSIRYVENDKNLGLCENFNQLFRLSTGSYFFWADQDDVRDPCFISKCVAVLESDRETVLCHSYTGVFWKKFENLMHITTINGVDNVSSVLRRYWRFLRRYSDTTIYGLIRSEALRKTELWRPDLGSANALLFELLLLGKFRQVPEVLYYYSAKGLCNRPTPEEEYFRQTCGRRLSKYRRPFLVLAFNQTKGIFASPCSLSSKGLILLMLWLHVAMVNFAKAIFRLVSAVMGRHVPKWFEDTCRYAVLDLRDIHFTIPQEKNRDYLPKAWLLR